MGINKQMPNQEIGLYRMSKQAKAEKEMKKEMSHMMNMANAVTMSKEMTAPVHNIIIKKK